MDNHLVYDHLEAVTASVVPQEVSNGGVVVAIGGLILLLVVCNQKRKHEHERAEETERILNTPLQRYEVEDDPLTQRYRD